MTRAKFLVLVAFSLACTTEKAPPADTTVAIGPDSAATTPSETPAAPGTTSTDTGSSTDIATWKVNTRGFGPIVAGMTVEEANNVSVGNQLVIPANLENECGFASLRAAPDVLFMIEKGVISRVDVTRASRITTEAGAKIGDTEAQIKSLYPGAETQPHKYTDGHYLVVTPSGTANQAYRLVFETDGQKVLRYRSGRMPAVQYVEGCS